MIKKFCLLSVLLLFFTFVNAQLTDPAIKDVNPQTDINMEPGENIENCNATPINLDLDKANENRDNTAAIVLALTGTALITGALVLHDLSNDATSYIIFIGTVSDILGVVCAFKGDNALKGGGYYQKRILRKP